MKVTIKKSSDAWRTSPWMVRYYEDRKPIRTFYKSREEAEHYARDLRQTFGSGAKPDEVAEALRLSRGTGYKLADLVKAGLDWIKSSAATSVSPSVTFESAMATFISNAVRKQRNGNTLVGYRIKQRMLKDSFGGRIATTITQHEVEVFLSSRCNRRGKPGEASWSTKKKWLSFICGALRTIGIQKPFPKLYLPETEQREVAYFT